MDVSVPASAVSTVVTVTVTTSVAEHPLLVTVTVYVVVTAGLATGFAIVVELNPAAGVQLYDVPPLAFNVADDPVQMLTSLPASAAGSGITVTVTTSVAEHPPPVTLTV